MSSLKILNIKNFAPFLFAFSHFLSNVASHENYRMFRTFLKRSRWFSGRNVFKFSIPSDYISGSSWENRVLVDEEVSRQ